MLKDNLLPPAKQKWAHSTCSQELLHAALTDSTITAIEVDILMGYEIQKDETYPLLESNLSTEKVGRIPIMAHPPELESDLTMQDFLMKASNPKDSNKKILKHIKLDFKEMDAVEPTIAAIDKQGIRFDTNASIYLNADVLPGPAMRKELPKMKGDDFLSICLASCQKVLGRIFMLIVQYCIVYLFAF